MLKNFIDCESLHVCNSVNYFCISERPSCFIGDGGGRPSSVMSLGVASVGGHSHGHPASPIGVGSLWKDINPRSPEPLVVRGGWLWLIWVVWWTNLAPHLRTLACPARLPWAATWRPCGLVSWGVEVWVAGAPAWPMKPPEVYTPIGPDPLDRQAAGCPCQSIAWLSLSVNRLETLVMVTLCWCVMGLFVHGGHFVHLSHGKKDVVDRMSGRVVVYWCLSVCEHCLL